MKLGQEMKTWRLDEPDGSVTSSWYFLLMRRPHCFTDRVCRYLFGVSFHHGGQICLSGCVHHSVNECPSMINKRLC